MMMTKLMQKTSKSKWSWCTEGEDDDDDDYDDKIVSDDDDGNVDAKDQ